MKESLENWLATKRNLVDVHHISRGGMGSVYKATDAKLNDVVAVKVLHSDLAVHDKYRLRFTHEAQILAELSRNVHNVVSIRYIDETPEGDAFYVMDYIDGADLSELIDERADREENFSVQETVELLGPIATTLDEIHQAKPPVFHRDIKPANILIDESPSKKGKVWLSDFGISLRPESPRLTSVGTHMVTPGYFDPDLVMGADARSDNFCLALVAFEMLTLTPVHQLVEKEEWQSRWPVPDLGMVGLSRNDSRHAPALQAVFDRALSHDRSERFATATEFINALSTAVTPRKSDAPATGVRQVAPTRPYTAQAPVQAGQSSAITWLAAVACLLSVGLVALVGVSVKKDPWSSADAPLAQALPGVVSTKEGGTGFGNTTCFAVEPMGQEQARLRCEGENLVVEARNYQDESARNAALVVDDADERVKLEWPRCSAWKLSTSTGDQALVVPEGRRSTMVIALIGDRAVETANELPLC